MGHNPVSIVVPCHRVVGSNGSLTGYAGGITRKVRLLNLERAEMSGLFVPEKRDRIVAAGRCRVFSFSRCPSG